ncbi:hypothetical protein HGM15179_017562 [Zosterops borbonicus]|uniref:Uncharacterized protein n=1 Tax=Zosterops borbonicus TaxID=364589 RepID=A0A8K1G0M4_9PASS|nr:hypothetical protein HGM15179_017562 [Zosterops borbonicus]
MQRWKCMSLAVGTCRQNGLGLVSSQLELSDQSRDILVKQLMTEFRLFEDVWERSNCQGRSQSISSPVSFRYESR